MLSFGWSSRIGGWQHHLNLVEGIICGEASEDKELYEVGEWRAEKDFCTHSGNKGGLVLVARASA